MKLSLLSAESFVPEIILNETAVIRIPNGKDVILVHVAFWRRLRELWLCVCYRHVADLRLTRTVRSGIPENA